VGRPAIAAASCSTPISGDGGIPSSLTAARGVGRVAPGRYA
jgi:hypothetical protein